MRLACLALLCLVTSGCSASRRPAAAASGASPAVIVGANARVDTLAERWFDEYLAVNPQTAASIGDARFNAVYTASFVPATRRRWLPIVAAYMDSLGRIDPAALDEEHRITHEFLRATLAQERDETRFPVHLVPLNQFRNFTATFAQMGSGVGLHPFRTVRDYDDFLSRIDGFGVVVDAAIGNMREGAQRGIVPPRVLMERTLPQLSAHLVTDHTRSTYWGPITRMPASFSPADRERLTAAYATAIRERVIPAYRRLHDFVRDEYLPRTRTTVGLLALPDGRAWYEHAVRTNTTTRLTPEEIHAIGLDEVARIHAEMRVVMRQAGWQGDLAGFMRRMQTDSSQRYTTREEMLADYRAAQRRIDATTDRLFDIKPRANYEIRPVEEFRERSASGGSYVAASPEGDRPGVFYLNTYEPRSRQRFGMESLLVHEGSPGHHFQISVARELRHLPRVRRFRGVTAFAEGWGLYAETLGRELGLYGDLDQYYGYLSSELWRAIRLVLDTGIHAKGWTLEQAMEYARRNSSSSELTIRTEVERFAAIPGQALAYKIGQLKITELRRRAERELGPRFDIRAFHRVVLESGALPLEVLESKVNRWIAAQRNG
ncbi:MAG TPA: DUF885 domain-containing protein [Gemmatimonadaceae bacterium]|nr:DUF885 domain-containing protein [Gemmatimonadaceae bacterium]